MTITVIRAGKAVQMWFNILNNTNMQAVVYDPPSLPLFTLFDPNGLIQVNAQPMTRIRQGLYSYTYSTPVSGTLGIWKAAVDFSVTSTIDGGSVDPDVPEKYVPVFQLV